MWTLKPYGAGRHGLATVEGSDSFGVERVVSCLYAFVINATQIVDQLRD